MDANGLGLGKLLVGVIIANIAVALLPLWIESDPGSTAARHQPKAESVELGTFSNNSDHQSKDHEITPIATDTNR
ncbi:MAG: hypothetical protein P8J87_07250 [Verrucomicrobiales bacterium]|nr:hypothetical protein [Verrucomicrobiales bacterium]